MKEDGDRPVDIFDASAREFPAEDGMKHLDGYVRGMLASRPGESWVTVVINNRDHGFSLIWQESQPAIVFCVMRHDRTADEARIRAFFDARETPPLQDYDALDGRMHVLVYGVPAEAGEVVTLCRRVLREVRGVGPEDRLYVLAED